MIYGIVSLSHGEAPPVGPSNIFVYIFFCLLLLSLPRFAECQIVKNGSFVMFLPPVRPRQQQKHSTCARHTANVCHQVNERTAKRWEDRSLSSAIHHQRGQLDLIKVTASLPHPTFKPTRSTTTAPPHPFVFLKLLTLRCRLARSRVPYTKPLTISFLFSASIKPLPLILPPQIHLHITQSDIGEGGSINARGNGVHTFAIGYCPGIYK